MKRNESQHRKEGKKCLLKAEERVVKGRKERVYETEGNPGTGKERNGGCKSS